MIKSIAKRLAYEITLLRIQLHWRRQLRTAGITNGPKMPRSMAEMLYRAGSVR